MLEKLRLRHFRQHKETVLEFVPGINTIVGDNNSGKSTIPEAIEFALYGSRALRDSAKGFITDGEQDGSAVVQLSVTPHSYTIGRNSKNAQVKCDGELTSQYKDNVSREVALITGVNQTAFRLGHYVRQKELSAFSSMRPGKRHETIERMLKVHAIDEAMELVKANMNEAELRQKVLLNAYADTDAIQNELDDIAIVEEALILRGEEYTKQIEVLKAELVVMRAEQEEYIKAVAKQLYNDKQMTAWEQDCIEASQAKIALDAIQEKLGKLDWSSYTEINNSLVAVRALEVKHAEMSAIKRELEDEPVLPDAVEQPVKPEEGLLLQANAELVAKQKQLDTLNSLIGKPKCPMCQGPLTEITEVIESLKEEYLKLQEAKIELYNTFSKEMTAYNASQLLYKAYAEAQVRYNERMTRRSVLLQKYVEVEFSPAKKLELETSLKELQAVKEESIRLTGEVNRLTPLAIDPPMPELDAVIIGQDQAEALKVLEADHTAVYEAFRVQASELAHAKGRVEELTRTLSQSLENKKALELVMVELAGYKTEYDTFLLFKRYLTAKIRPMLQEVAEALFHKVTKNRYASYQLGGDYEISCTTHRGYIRKLATISGSENDLACLCLRLAIATLRSTKLAGSLGFVILDEISGAFDDDRTKQTLEGLLELRDVIPQIINITHKPVEMRFADRLFTVVETGGIAKVTYA